MCLGFSSSGRDGALRGLVCEGERRSLPGEDELEETLVSSRAEEQYDRSAVFQVQYEKGGNEIKREREGV